MENPGYNRAVVVSKANNDHKPVVVDSKFHDYIPVVMREDLRGTSPAHSSNSSSTTSISSPTITPPPRPPKPSTPILPSKSQISPSSSSTPSSESLMLPSKSPVSLSQIRSLNQTKNQKPNKPNHPQKMKRLSDSGNPIKNEVTTPKVKTNIIRSGIVQRKPSSSKNVMQRLHSPAVSSVRIGLDAQSQTPTSKLERPQRLYLIEQRFSRRKIETPHISPASVSVDNREGNHLSLHIKNKRKSSTATQTPVVTDTDKNDDSLDDDHGNKHRPANIDDDDNKNKSYRAVTVELGSNVENGTVACISRNDRNDYDSIIELATTPDVLPTKICVDIANRNTPEPVYWAPVTLTSREDGSIAIAFYGNPFENLHRLLKTGLKEINPSTVSNNRLQPISSQSCKIRWSLITFAIIVCLCVGTAIASAFHIAATSSAKNVVFVVNTGTLNTSDFQYANGVSEVIGKLFPLLQRVDRIEFSYATFHGNVTHCSRPMHLQMAEDQLTRLDDDIHFAEHTDQTAAVKSILDQLKDIEAENLIVTVFAANRNAYHDDRSYEVDLVETRDVVLQHKRMILIGEPILPHIINASMPSDKIAQQISIEINTSTF